MADDYNWLYNNSLLPLLLVYHDAQYFSIERDEDDEEDDDGGKERRPEGKGRKMGGGIMTFPLIPYRTACRLSEGNLIQRLISSIGILGIILLGTL